MDPKWKISKRWNVGHCSTEIFHHSAATQERNLEIMECSEKTLIHCASVAMMMMMMIGNNRNILRGLGTKPQYLCPWDGAYSCVAAHCRDHSGDAGSLKQRCRVAG